LQIGYTGPISTVWTLLHRVPQNARWVFIYKLKPRERSS